MSEEKKISVNDLIERGKSKGSLSSSEIMEALEDVDYDLEQIEKLYETLEGMGVEVTGYLDTPEFTEIENEVEQFESAEDMEKMLSIAGAPVLPTDIGIERELFRESLVGAWKVRNRYSVLQVAVENERIEEIADIITERIYG